MKIYQIFYDESSKSQLDSSYIPYDNSESMNSDWYEYAAIRDIFSRQSFDSDEYIGVFSPRFLLKTGLTGKEVIQLAGNCQSEVISFSPFFDQIALFKNPFVQGDYWHPGLLKTSHDLFRQIGLNINLNTMVSDQTRAIFSHYFLAKPLFWNQYLEFSEKIFKIATGNSVMSTQLNKLVTYKSKLRKDVALKVFIMERLPSAILESLNMNADIGFSYQVYAARQNSRTIFNNWLVLDAMKTTFLKTKNPYYLKMHEHVSQKMLRMRTSF